jgi:hypothetical protein
MKEPSSLRIKRQASKDSQSPETNIAGFQKGKKKRWERRKLLQESGPFLQTCNSSQARRQNHEFLKEKLKVNYHPIRSHSL